MLVLRKAAEFLSTTLCARIGLIWKTAGTLRCEGLTEDYTTTIQVLCVRTD